MNESSSSASTRLVTDDDLALFFLMHEVIGAHLAAFVRIDASRRAALAQWFGFMQRAIRVHHEGEAAELYPMLLSRDPRSPGSSPRSRRITPSSTRSPRRCTRP